METASILIVEDEQTICRSLQRRLTREGFRVARAENAAEAREHLSSGTFDVAILDYRLPDADGISLLREVKGQSPQTIAIMVTAFSTVNLAVEALRVGADDFVTKPFNTDEIVLSIGQLLETRHLRDEVTRIRTVEGRHYSLDALVGRSPAMVRLKEIIRDIAVSPAITLLLEGPSGVGKDIVAKVIHYNSPRADRPFVNITCTAIAESLLESELFGHERGAFTDAREQKKGLFEIADGGTVFLDEIGDMPFALQAKLLRFLEERSFRRVGGTQDQHVDVRVISATNRNLQSLVATGNFRPDLFYRLNTVPLVIPRLKDRMEDVPLLAERFVWEFNREMRRNVKGLEPEAMKRLTSYDWPGNVRELRNVIERAILLGKGDRIRAQDLSHQAPTGDSPASPETEEAASLLGPDGVDLREVERRLVVEAIERAGGNQTRAAKLLRISRDQLRYRLEKFGLLASKRGRRPQDARTPRGAE